MQMQRDELEQRIQQQNEELSIQKDEFNQQLQAQATTVDYLLSSIQSLTKQMSEIQNLGPTSETHEPRFDQALDVKSAPFSGNRRGERVLHYSERARSDQRSDEEPSPFVQPQVDLDLSNMN